MAGRDEEEERAGGGWASDREGCGGAWKSRPGRAGVVGVRGGGAMWGEGRCGWGGPVSPGSWEGRCGWGGPVSPGSWEGRCGCGGPVSPGSWEGPGSAPWATCGVRKEQRGAEGSEEEEDGEKARGGSSSMRETVRGQWRGMEKMLGVEKEWGWDARVGVRVGVEGAAEGKGAGGRKEERRSWRVVVAEGGGGGLVMREEGGVSEVELMKSRRLRGRRGDGDVN